MFFFTAQHSEANCTKRVNSLHATQEAENTHTARRNNWIIIFQMTRLQCRWNLWLLPSIEKAWTSIVPLQWQPSPYVPFSVSLPQSSNNHCSMASFSRLVRRLTKTNECKSMHASDQRRLLCEEPARNFLLVPNQPDLLSANSLVIINYCNY